MNYSLPQPKSVDCFLKMAVYIMCTAAEDVETQKRGVVLGLFYFTSALQTVQKLPQRRGRVFEWFPLRIVGMHFCFSDPKYRPVKAILMLMIGKERRVRVRTHEGSHTECQNALLTFGVPTSNFPVTYDGELKTANHLKWLARRKAKEAAVVTGGSFEGIDLPSAQDVLLGKGKIVQEHSGNVIMRNLVYSYMVDYKRSPPNFGNKEHFVQKVMQDIKSTGGRFLDRDGSGWWVEVWDEKAHDKVSMAFRTRTTPSTSQAITSMRPRPPIPQRPNANSSVVYQMTEREFKRTSEDETTVCPPIVYR